MAKTSGGGASGSGGRSGSRTEGTKVAFTKQADGYASAHGKEPFVISLVDGFPKAAKADVSIEPPNAEGKIFARVSVGNWHEGKWFDTFGAAAEWGDRFINPPEGRRLSNIVRAKGYLIEAKYAGTDYLNQSYSKGDKIYFYPDKNSNAKYILKA
jgi:hypothetical protein